MVGDLGWEHEGTECQVDTVKCLQFPKINIIQQDLRKIFWQF